MERGDRAARAQLSPVCVLPDMTGASGLALSRPLAEKAAAEDIVRGHGEQVHTVVQNQPAPQFELHLPGQPLHEPHLHCTHPCKIHLLLKALRRLPVQNRSSKFLHDCVP